MADTPDKFLHMSNEEEKNITLSYSKLRIRDKCIILKIKKRQIVIHLVIYY